MRNFKCLFSLVFWVFYPVSGMLVPIQKIEQQFLPKDCLKQVQWKCDLQSLGRLAATCSYMNNNWQVEDFSKKQFGLVEKCLYFYAPKASLRVCESTTQFAEIYQIKQRLCKIIEAHTQEVDANINKIHSHVTEGWLAPFFYNELKLTNDDRIAFYFGKLPGQKPKFSSFLEYDSESEDVQQEYADPLSEDIMDAAHEDAKLAIMNGDAERARVVLNRYKQFATHENDFLGLLCALGNGPLLLDYLSIPERSIEYTMAPSGYTAIEIARDECEDDELVAFLEQAIEDAKK